MPNLFQLFLQNVISPLLLVCFLIVILCGIATTDGVPIARALVLLLIKLIVDFTVWSFKLALSILTLVFPALEKSVEHLFNPGCKSKGKKTIF